MGIRVETSNPQALLAAVKEAIKKDRIRTWSCDGEGDFTHSADQWNLKAWLRPSLESGALVLRILAPKGQRISKEVYGIYHGRFIEMLLVHFDGQFSDAYATAMPTSRDVVAA